MSLSDSMDGFNKKLATALGHTKDLEKTFEKISKIAAKSDVSTIGGGTAKAGGTSGGRASFMASSLGVVSAVSGPVTSSKSGSEVRAAGSDSVNRFGRAVASFASNGSGNTAQGGGARAGSAGGGGNFGGTGSGGGLVPSSNEAATGGSRFGGLSIAAGVGAAVWNGTPGAQDAVTNQTMLFQTAFSTSGPYANKGTNQRILEGINNGSSGVFDPVAASAAMTASSFTMNMGKTQDAMLTSAGTMYQLTGMNNVASVQGSMALTQGSTGISDKLLGIGISTVNSKGDPKDIGSVMDQLWSRWYPGGGVTEEQLDRDIAMGFVGADLQELYGQQPALYAQAVQFLRLKAKEGGRSGIKFGLKEGKNSAQVVAQKHGLNEYNSPMAAMGDVNTTHGTMVMDASEGLLSGYVGGTNIEQATSSLAAQFIDLLGPIGDFGMAIKGVTQTASAGNTAGPLISSIMGVIGGIMPFSGGGPVRGSGGSIQDNISANISAGEYVVNARAVQTVGVDTLNRLNALGHDFGSGYASPARAFNKGGAAGESIVAFASQFVGTPYIKPEDRKGPASPENGWDCSTFTQYVFKQFGKSVPGYSDSYLNVGDPVDQEDWQPGDLLLWKTSNDKKTGHVSIYAGNNEHVHAANVDVGTVRGPISDWYRSRYVGARRVTGITSSPSGVTLGGSTTPDAGVSNLAEPYKNPALLAASQIGASVDYAKDFAMPSSTSLSGFGATAQGMGSFTTSGIDAGSLATNAGVLTTNLESLFAGLGAGSPKVNDTQASDTPGGPSPETRGGSGKSGSGAAYVANTKLLKLLTSVGFVGENLREAWAMVMRESRGNANSHNTTPPDDSYGLFQINYYDPEEAAERDRKFSEYVPGYKSRADLFNPEINARAAAYMSQKGKNWSAWGDPRVVAQPWYDDYNPRAPSASHGMETVSRDGPVNLHQGEMIFPAAAAQDFRDALREALGGGGNKQQVTVNLNIERASDDEAERFANKVIAMLENKDRVSRIGRS